MAVRASNMKLMQIIPSLCFNYKKAKGKAIPIQAWTGPEHSRRFRFPDFQTIGTGRWKHCQPHALAALSPQEISLVLISVTG